MRRTHNDSADKTAILAGLPTPRCQIWETFGKQITLGSLKKVSQVFVFIAPRDGTEIGEKASGILGFFDFSAFEIPPKTPLQKMAATGRCRIIADTIVRFSGLRVQI